MERLNEDVDLPQLGAARLARASAYACLDPSPDGPLSARYWDFRCHDPVTSADATISVGLDSGEIAALEVRSFPQTAPTIERTPTAPDLETQARACCGFDASHFRLTAREEHGGREDALAYESRDPWFHGVVVRLRGQSGRLVGVETQASVPADLARRLRENLHASSATAELSEYARLALVAVGAIAALRMRRTARPRWRWVLFGSFSIAALRAVETWAASSTFLFDGAAASVFFSSRGRILLATLPPLGNALGDLPEALLLCTVVSALSSVPGIDEPSVPRPADMPDLRASRHPLLALYLLAPVCLAASVAYYQSAWRWVGWRRSDAGWFPAAGWQSPGVGILAMALRAGVWEELAFRALPFGVATVAAHAYGRRRLWMVGALFGSTVIFALEHHGVDPAMPWLARPAEVVLPGLVFAGVFLRYGLLPVMLLHSMSDLLTFAYALYCYHALTVSASVSVVAVSMALPIVLLAMRSQTPQGAPGLVRATPPPPPAPHAVGP